LCSTFGHTAPHCPQFRSSSQQPSTHLVVGNVSAATWFPDTGANQHGTPDLATLTDSATYLGNDHLHVSDGKGLDISHIGHTTLHSPKRIFTLSNVLHVPYITKSLLSVQKLYRDNHVYFEFYASMFYVKDLITKEFLLSGQALMVFMSSLCLLSCQFLKLFGLLTSPRLPTCGIVVWVIQPLVFYIC
jgi:hypothetical protein